MEEEELNIDPAAICRCCLAEHDALRAIFSKEIINGSIVSFRSVFECVVGFQIQRHDGFPQNLCLPCRKIVVQSYVFKQKCNTNRQLLRTVLDKSAADQPPATRAGCTRATKPTAAARPKRPSNDEKPRPVFELAVVQPEPVVEQLRTPKIEYDSSSEDDDTHGDLAKSSDDDDHYDDDVDHDEHDDDDYTPIKKRPHSDVSKPATKPFKRNVDDDEMTDEQIEALGKIPKILNGQLFRIKHCDERQVVQARCLLCNCTFRGALRTTSNFLKHLQLKHVKEHREFRMNCQSR